MDTIFIISSLVVTFIYMVIYHKFFRVYYFNLQRGLLGEFITAFILAILTVGLFIAVVGKVLGTVASLIGIVLKILVFLVIAAVVIGIASAIIYAVSKYVKQNRSKTNETEQETDKQADNTPEELLEAEPEQGSNRFFSGAWQKKEKVKSEYAETKEKASEHKKKKLWFPVAGGMLLLIVVFLFISGSETEGVSGDLGVAAMGSKEFAEFIESDKNLVMNEENIYSDQDGTVTVILDEKVIPVYVDLKDNKYSFFSMRVGDEYIEGKTDSALVKEHGYAIFNQTDDYVVYEAADSPSYNKQVGIAIKEGRIQEIIYYSEKIELETDTLDESLTTETEMIFESVEAETIQVVESSEFNEEELLGVYECHTEYLDAIAEIRSDGEMSIALYGNSTDGLSNAEFHSDVIYQDGNSYTAVDVDGNKIYFYYDGTGILEIRDNNYSTLGGIAFPSFTGLYEKSENHQAEPLEMMEEDTDDQWEFVFYDSDTRYLTHQEVKDLTQETLRLAKNEIYARHGRVFTSNDLKAHFESTSWYEGTIPAEQFDESIFNPIEKANILLIQSYITD